VSTFSELDYDNLAESVGVRVQDSDHLVEAVLAEVGDPLSLEQAIQSTTKIRDEAVTAGQYAKAFIADTLVNDLRRLEEDSEDDEVEREYCTGCENILDDHDPPGTRCKSCANKKED
jgi:hypothetical protein